MKWNKTDIDRDKVREFSSRFGTDLLTTSILIRRGVTEYEDMIYFLENDTGYLHNPFLFEEMEETVDRILQAAEEGEKVMIFGDRDVDGISALVLLYEALTDIGLEVSWKLPMGDDPYGLTKEAVSEFADQDGTLIITVDCGISSYEEISYALEFGIDTIVVDHHNPHETVPQAYSIINPKMEDSGYPFEGLAGCAVVAKVIWALNFARTDIYNRQVCLFNIRPGNDIYIIEAVKLVNLIEVDRIVENIVPGMVSPEQTRLMPFLSGQEIIVYDKKSQLNAFKAVFGNSVELNVYDLAPDIWKKFPVLENKSLFRIRESSRVSRYTNGSMAEVDIFTRIFTKFVLEDQTGLQENFEKCLDLVALGTLADLMPLVNENRILVRLGMDVLKKGMRPGLYELMLKQGLLSKNLGTKDVAWNLTPLINATGRMGVPDTTVNLLLSESEAERKELADEVASLNRERKNLGEKAWNSSLPKAYKSFSEMDEKMVIVSDDSIHRGITGIIAARLVNHFNVASCVISTQNDKAVGSLRSAGNVNVKNLLSTCDDLFYDYGGHDFAAGFSMPRDNIARFISAMKKAVTEREMESPPEESVYVDAELPHNYMNPQLIDVVEKLEPYGEGNRPLVFWVKGGVIEDIMLIGKKDKQHVKMTLGVGENRWPAVFWNAADKVNSEFAQGDSVELLFRLGRNYYQNREHLQLTIVDIKR